MQQPTLDTNTPAGVIQIRHALPADLDYCLQLDGSFDTQRVWQLDMRESHQRVDVQLRATPLPRELRVAYPTPTESLLVHWQRGYCVLVAEEENSGALLGYVDVGPEPDLQLGWIWHLVVDQSVRRHGIGSLLLQGAVAWSRENDLRRLMAPLQSQNDPGIQFCRRHGMTFYGFNDRFYRNGSVTLFFGRNLR